MEVKMIKKSILLLAAILLLSRPSFAGELMAELAPEYYHKGINCERSGMLFEAKVFYQKALLLDPASRDAASIKDKIARINSTLSFAESNPPTDYVVEESQNPLETKQAYRGEDMQISQPSVMQRYSSEGTPAKIANITTAPGITKTPKVAVKPKPKVLEFLTYYNGSEPFLQNCFTPLCQKFIFNDFGIAYAKDGAFLKARGMFEECLKIDSSFKPASFNLSLLDSLERERNQ